MGLVYEAEHIRLGRKAALKVLDPELASDGNFRARFVEESRLIAAIEHPNIIPIYDADEVDGILYIAMRYVDGGDLKALIERFGALDASSTLRIFGQAAAALDAAHARDLIHRDVKPANLLIDDTVGGAAFLTDFGIAKRAGTSDATTVGLFVGSVDYAPPEQLEGKTVTASADVYALTAVLYECLTGRRPFERETDVAVVYAHLLDPPPSVAEIRGDLPPGLDEVVATGMAKDPDHRYRSAADLLAALRVALGGAPSERTPESSLAALRPARRPAAAAPLPIPATPLIGRGQELDRLTGLLRADDVRLVSAIGPGGSGKTRLAIQAAREVGPDFADGVVFLSLAAVPSATRMTSALAEALGVEEQPTSGGVAADEDELLGALERRLSGARILVVLDNFEHLLPAAAVIAKLLNGAPAFKLLITSQAALRVQGEHEVPVPPLELPPKDAVDPEIVGRSPAVALFVQTACAAHPGFELTDENAAAVGVVCSRLDGLPLAIELAAARIKVLSPQAMVSRLENRLALLTGAGRGRPSRHQTLRSMIDWSFELLEPQAQAFFAQLAVFEDGFTLDAAEDVCRAESDPDLDSLEAVESLVDKSLLAVADGSEGEPRFALLQTIQEYARYRLIDAGDLDDTRRRHAEHFLRLVEVAEPELLGANQAEWVRRLEEESGNIRAGVAWALEAGSTEVALRIAGALTRFWSVRGSMSEGRGWLTRALQAQAEVPVGVRAKGLFAAGYAALGQGDYDDAIGCFEESLELYRGAGDVVGAAASLAQLGWLLAVRGDETRSAALSEEGLALARTAGDARTESVALSNLAELAAREGELDRAAELFGAALSLRRGLGDRRNIANALLNLGRIELLRGSSERATKLLDEGLALSRDVNDTWGTSVALNALGLLSLRAGDRTAVGDRLAEVLSTSLARGDKRAMAECLISAAAVEAADDPKRAARLVGAAESLREAMRVPPSPVEKALYEVDLAPVLTSAFADEREEGRALGFEGAVAYALAGMRPH